MKAYLIYHDNYCFDAVITKVHEIHSDLDNAIGRCKEIALTIDKGEWRNGVNPYVKPHVKFMLDIGDKYPHNSYTIFVKEFDLK